MRHARTFKIAGCSLVFRKSIVNRQTARHSPPFQSLSLSVPHPLSVAHPTAKRRSRAKPKQPPRTDELLVGCWLVRLLNVSWSWGCRHVAGVTYTITNSHPANTYSQHMAYVTMPLKFVSRHKLSIASFQLLPLQRTPPALTLVGERNNGRFRNSVS